MSPRHTLMRSLIGRVLVLPVLAWAMGQLAHGQQPTVHARQIAAPEEMFEKPVWETHCAVGPSRAVAVFIRGTRLTALRVGYGVWDSTQGWFTTGTVGPDVWASDPSVRWYDSAVGDGGDEGDGEDFGGIPVRGFVAAGLLARGGSAEIAVAHMGSASTTFSPWRAIARDPSLDKPWLVGGNSSGTELYALYSLSEWLAVRVPPFPRRGRNVVSSRSGLSSGRDCGGRKPRHRG